MKNFVLIPDSFKGTMSSSEICQIMKENILKHNPDANVVSVPVADGGEGSVDSFITAVGGKKYEAIVSGPYFEDINSFYGVISNNVAIIEMAAAAGLPLVGDELHAEKTTTYGVGQLIKCALDLGCKKIIMGLGGSATNDAGCGAAAALGASFYNSENEKFVPVGETLHKIARIDLTNLDARLSHTEIVTMCDINNPLAGKNGAAYVFAPQKGADSEMVEFLDKGLVHFANIVKLQLGKEIINLSGAGAAGGMGGGMVAFFNSTLQMGIETVLDTVNFDNLLKSTDIVFSGEGKIDVQSLSGKVVIGVANRAKKYNVPVVAIVGDIGDNIENAYDMGVSAIFSINRVAVPFKEARFRSKSDLGLTMDNIMRFLKIV